MARLTSGEQGAAGKVAAGGGTIGEVVVGGVRFVSRELAASAAMEMPRRNGCERAHEPKPADSGDEMLLGWAQIAVEIYGYEAGRKKTWDAIDHLWSEGLSDGRGGVIRLASRETPAGRRSTVRQCRAFLDELTAARTAARAARGGGGGGGRGGVGRSRRSAGGGEFTDGLHRPGRDAGS